MAEIRSRPASRRRSTIDRRELLESTLSVGQIAGELSYEDIFSFSRQFKEHTSNTRTEYRSGPRR